MFILVYFSKTLSYGGLILEMLVLLWDVRYATLPLVALGVLFEIFVVLRLFIFIPATLNTRVTQFNRRIAPCIYRMILSYNVTSF